MPVFCCKDFARMIGKRFQRHIRLKKNVGIISEPYAKRIFFKIISSRSPPVAYLNARLPAGNDPKQRMTGT
jgi:hypothetical protein